MTRPQTCSNDKSDNEEYEEKPLKEDATDAIKFKNKTFKGKVSHVRSNVTVEPLLAGVIIPSVISRFAMGNLNLDKACRVHMQYADVICDALIKRTTNNFTAQEKEIQRLISSIDIWKGIVQTLLPCIIIMFLGAWSDRTGKRKLCILMPIFGEILTSINNLINVYFFYEIPVHLTVFLETLFTAATGGWVTMFLGIFSYISDITTEKTRTFRVGLANFCMTVGLPIGIALGGILIQKLGYYTIFSMTSSMFTLIFLYGYFFLQEPQTFLEHNGMKHEKNEVVRDAPLLDLSHLSETLSVMCKRRPKNIRLKLILTLVAVFVLFGPTMAEHTVMYLYMRNRLNWDMVKFSIFASFSIFLHSIGALFSISVFSRRLQFHDSLLCLISCSSKFVGSIWTAFVKTDLEMFLVPVVEILNGVTFTSLRSLMTKLVQKDEIARANSLFSLVETIASLVFQPMYSWIYMMTLHVFPGTVYIFSATMVIPAMVILTTFFVQHRLQLWKEKKKKILDAEVVVLNYDTELITKNTLNEKIKT